jgi:hypothetical protein
MRFKKRISKFPTPPVKQSWLLHVDLSIFSFQFNEDGKQHDNNTRVSSYIESWKLSSVETRRSETFTILWVWV